MSNMKNGPGMEQQAPRWDREPPELGLGGTWSSVQWYLFFFNASKLILVRPEKW